MFSGKVKVASICGTDLHIFEWDRWAQGRIHPPLIPGHEICGEVVAFGDEVTSVKEGDFVSAEMHVACGKCLQCRTGEAHICQNVKIIGVDTNGAFAEYVVIPESNIWKLDPAIPRSTRPSWIRWATQCTPCWREKSPRKPSPSLAAAPSDCLGSRFTQTCSTTTIHHQIYNLLRSASTTFSPLTRGQPSNFQIIS